MKTEDLNISLHYHVMSAFNSAIFLTAQPGVDKTKMARIQSLLKCARDIIETPEKPQELAKLDTLDFSEAKERSIAP